MFQFKFCYCSHLSYSPVFVLVYFFLTCRHDRITYVDPSELEMLLRLLAPTSPVVKCLEGRLWLVEGATKGWLWHRSGGTTSCDRWILLLLGELRFLVPPSAGTKIYNQQNNNTDFCVSLTSKVISRRGVLLLQNQFKSWPSKASEKE